MNSVEFSTVLAEARERGFEHVYAYALGAAIEWLSDAQRAQVADMVITYTAFIEDKPA